ncbi:MAG: hypothetical protein JSW66_09955 [Phycisphaerales bacterium]|nr:MAG: hypothetical protein JSW66_09955 [Phycisphaerales bacterium]
MSSCDDFFTSDTSPTHGDIKGTLEMNVCLTNKLRTWLERQDPGQLDAIAAKGDYLQTWQWIEGGLLSL